MLQLKERIEYQSFFLKALRDFFASEDFSEVLVPPMVPCPGIETHIHPFQVYSSQKKELTSFYLQTSPEFYMKELLSVGMERIYNISHCYRDEPQSEIHRPQFLMLEWYRANKRYDSLMQDCQKLIDFLLSREPEGFKWKYSTPFKLEKRSMREVFSEVLNVDLYDLLDKQNIKEYLQEKKTDLPLPEAELSWEDSFFLLFLNLIEPHLKEYGGLILTEFPAPLAALSTLKKDDPKVCERFELFINGVEIANCFNELTNLSVQRERAKKNLKQKSDLYQYEVPPPNVLYSALEKGLPSSSGIALGVERLAGELIGAPIFYN